MTARRRRAPAGVLLAAALAACADSPPAADLDPAEDLAGSAPVACHTLNDEEGPDVTVLVDVERQGERVACGEDLRLVVAGEELAPSSCAANGGTTATFRLRATYATRADLYSADRQVAPTGHHLPVPTYCDAAFPHVLVYLALEEL